MYTHRNMFMTKGDGTGVEISAPPSTPYHYLKFSDNDCSFYNFVFEPFT